MVQERIFEHRRVQHADEENRVDMRETGIALMLTLLHVQYNLVDVGLMDHKHIERLVKHMSPICNSGGDENCFLTRLGYIVARLMNLADPDKLTDLVRVAKEECLRPLASAGLEHLKGMRELRNQVEGLWPLSYLSSEAHKG